MAVTKVNRQVEWSGASSVSGSASSNATSDAHTFDSTSVSAMITTKCDNGSTPSTGDTVEVVNYPLLWRATGTSWGIIGDAQQVVTQRKQPLMSYPWTLTTERAKAGGNIFYKPVIRPDFSKVVALTDADYDTLVVFGEMLKEENAVIEDEYTEAKRKLHNPSDDALEAMIN